MKRLWLILLSLVFVLAFSVQAMAVEVKFSGEFYAAGMYLDRTNLMKDTNSDGPSTAFYFQRLRVRTDFIVAPGLSLITRFTALERAWGAPRSGPSSYADGISIPGAEGDYHVSAGTTAENENIAFDWAYIQYMSPIGTFTVGYQSDLAWGTVFGNNAINGGPLPKIGWSMQFGGWTALAQIAKIEDNSYTAKNTGIVTTDLDWDRYSAGVIYAWKGGDAGVLLTYDRNAVMKDYSDGTLIQLYGILPYARAQIGPVKIQAELAYYWGDWKENDGTGTSSTLQGINFFLDAIADFNKFYIGGTFAYLSGDNDDTDDKIEGGGVLAWGGANGGGLDWNPCLIMFNFDRTYWAGSLYGFDHQWRGMNSTMQNAWFFQGRGGLRPLAALDIMASVSYAFADQKPANFLSRTYGTEIDLTATYKITNNLTYMLGVGYLFTGEYSKASYSDVNVRDDYLLINKLTLTF